MITFILVIVVALLYLSAVASGQKVRDLMDEKKEDLELLVWCRDIIDRQRVVIDGLFDIIHKKQSIADQTMIDDIINEINEIKGGNNE